MVDMLKNGVQNFDLQQKQVMMMGGMIDSKQNKLSPEAIKQIKKDYVKMYFGFVSINWGMGKTLGVSWQKALEQMESYIISKLKIRNHPMNIEFAKMHREFRHDMAKHIMTNPYTEEILNKEYKKSFVDYGTECVKSGKRSLDNMYMAYMPKQNERHQIASVKFNFANQKMQQILQQMLMYQKTNQHAA